MLISMIMTMLINLMYTILAILFAVFAVKFVDNKVFTRIDFQVVMKNAGGWGGQFVTKHYEMISRFDEF